MASDLTDVDLAGLVSASEIRRIHVLAWRDLDDPEAGGSELHLHEVTRRWAACGLEVCVRTSAVPDGPTTIVRDGVEVVRRAGRYQVFPRSALAEMLGRHGRRDALVEVWNGVPFLTPLWARGPRMAIQHHDHAAMWPLVLPPGAARLGSLLEHRIAPPWYRRTPVVTLSASSRDGLLDGLGHQPEGVHVVEPGIDPRFSPAGRRDPGGLVVSVGRLTTSKRVDVLIRAFAEARDRVPDLHLEVIGDGPQEADLRALAARLGVAPAVAFRGRVSDADLVDAYRRARLVASASISEGWGMTLTEAAACGTPAVATDIAGHRDAVADGRSGLLATDDDALSDLIVEAVGSRWDQLSAGALANAGRFDWDRTAAGAFRILASTAPSP